MTPLDLLRIVTGENRCAVVLPPHRIWNSTGTREIGNLIPAIEAFPVDDVLVRTVHNILCLYHLVHCLNHLNNVAEITPNERTILASHLYISRQIVEERLFSQTRTPAFESWCLCCNLFESFYSTNISPRRFFLKPKKKLLFVRVFRFMFL